MPTFRIKPEDIAGPPGKDAARRLKREVFERFTPAVLGLGSLDQEAKPYPTIAAVFDLEGFTAFNRQIEPQLSIPAFLHAFLDWIFAVIRAETLRKAAGAEVRLWHDLPFFTKFSGDGILFLWCTEIMDEKAQHALIVSLLDITRRYETEFYPTMKRQVVDAPLRLRCGVAKGTAFSVGNGEDYVGSCINLASRLQKLHGLGFALTRRGFNPEGVWAPGEMKQWLLKTVAIRGIGEHELVYVRKDEFEALPKSERAGFKDV